MDLRLAPEHDDFMHWDTLISRFIAHLRAAGYSPETIRLRRYYLERFMPNDGQVPTLEDLTLILSHPSWSNDTRRSVRSSFRVFWRWYAETYAGTNPADKLPAVRESAPAPRPASEEALMEAIRSADPSTRLMLQLAAYAGLRRAEISKTRGDHLVREVDGWTLKVLGKGAKVRYIPIPTFLAHKIQAAASAGGGWCFPSPQGGHLTAGTVGSKMSAVLPGDLTAHSLRHRYATMVYRRTNDLLATQKLLGHATPNTTQRYVAVDEARLRAAAMTASSLVAA